MRDDLDTIATAEFDRLRAELLQAGYEPVDETGLRDWEGPISPTFKGLTAATRMRIRFRDGWPFVPPYAVVQGLNAEHYNAEGVVCLWRDDDPNRDWMDLDSILRRISEWTERARAGFGAEDLALDGHLAFAAVCDSLVAVDPTSIREGTFQNGEHGVLHGRPVHGNLVELLLGEGGDGTIPARWYYRERIESRPKDFDTFRAALTASQQRNLDRALERHAGGGSAIPLLAALLRKREGNLDVLVVAISGTPGQLTATALPVAPTDEPTLLARAGLDAPLLRPKRVVVFGCGAIGSHASILLAESGLGFLRLVDGARLRPGHVVRHAAGSEGVGYLKIAATAAAIALRARWTIVEKVAQSTTAPKLLVQLCEGADLAIDAVGSGPFSELLSRIAEAQAIPLLSVALYCGGAVCRVRRQMLQLDAPIYRRREDDRFPVIPAEPVGEGARRLEIGCSSPVNNASPYAVTSAGSLAARTAIDALSGRCTYPAEAIDVFRPLSSPPFDQIGTVCIG